MKKINLINKMKAFTLIELLVVITIIGILATIVIVNLNSARGRAQDAAITEQMSQIRSQTALYYSDNFGYSVQGATSYSNGTQAACAPASGWANTAFADADFQKSVAGIFKNSTVPPQCVLGTNSAANSQSWAMFAKMRVDSTSYWCVDSSGASVKVQGAGTAFPTASTSMSGTMTNVSCQ